MRVKVTKLDTFQRPKGRAISPSKPNIDTFEHSEEHKGVSVETEVEEDAIRAGFLEDHFSLALVGGCLGGMVVIVVLTSLLLTLRSGRGRPPLHPLLHTEVSQFSSREHRVLSLMMRNAQRSVRKSLRWPQSRV